MPKDALNLTEKSFEPIPTILGKRRVIEMYKKNDPQVKATVGQVLGIARYAGIQLNATTSTFDARVILYVELRIGGDKKFRGMSDQHLFAEVLRLQNDTVSLEKLIRAYPNISF